MQGPSTRFGRTDVSNFNQIAASCIATLFATLIFISAAVGPAVVV
jgi:hypothetical protein